jgi:hypothetical protein
VLETCNFGPIDPGPLAEAVAEVYLGDKMGPKPPRAASAQQQSAADSGVRAGASSDYANLTGEYYSEDVDATYRVMARDGRLMYEAHHIPARALVPTGPDTFRAGDLILRFERSEPGGMATAFTIGGGRALGFKFRRR